MMKGWKKLWLMKNVAREGQGGLAYSGICDTQGEGGGRLILRTSCVYFVSIYTTGDGHLQSESEGSEV